MNKWLHKFMEKPDNTDKPDKSDNTDKWDGNLENMPGEGPDKPDRLDPSLNLSVLSGRPWGLLEKNLRNIPEIGPDISDITDKPDISDRLGPNLNLSGLSDRPWNLLEENLEINPRQGSDKSDRFKLRANMSPYEGGLLSALSVPLKGPFSETSFYPLKATSLLNEYQERLAIAEYDGHQSPTQAQRIAYLDAFVSVLVTLPYEDAEGDWLHQRIRAAKEWLLTQGLVQAK